MINLRDKLAKKGYKGEKDRKSYGEIYTGSAKPRAYVQFPTKQLRFFIDQVFFVQAFTNE